MIAGRELDALVATEIFGFKVLAEPQTIVHVEGEPSVHVDSDPDGWMCYAELGPVHARDTGQLYERPTLEDYSHCREPERRYKDDAAKFDADMKRFGCPDYFLEAVNWYSTLIAAAWEVWERLDSEHEVLISREEGRWVVHIVARGCDNEKHHKELAFEVADTAPHAICLAALAAVGALPPATEK